MASKRSSEPANPLDCVGLQVYPAAFSNSGDFQGIAEHVAYLKILGTRFVIIAGPPWEYGGQDGPYSPSITLGSLRVDARLGGEDGLRTMLMALKDAGIMVFGDAVVNHLWSGSHLVQEALNGNRQAQDCLRIIHNPEPGWFSQPNLFGLEPLVRLQELEEGPDDLIYVRSTFYHDQFDINGRSPVMQEYLTFVLTEAVKRGFNGLRLDAVGHVGGTYLETKDGLLTPTSFDLIRHLHQKAPGIPLIAEVSGDRAYVAPYLQEGLCSMAYDLAFSGYALLSLLREDFSLLREYMGTPLAIAPNARLLTTMGVHDDVNIGLLPAHLRDEVLNALGGENGRFVVFGRALNQRLGMLTRSQSAHHMLLSLMMCLPGTPVLYQGDAEWRQGAVDAPEREPRRDKMLYSPLTDDVLAPGYASDAWTPGVSVQEQLLSSGSPLNVIRAIIALRNRSEALQRGDYRVLASSNNAMYTFSRSTDKESLIVIANPSRFPKSIKVDLNTWNGQRIYKFLTREGRWQEIASAKSSYSIDIRPESITILRPRK